jgi:ADP-heptose:LPS heptosyltransferase
MQRGRKSNRILDYWIGTPLLNFAATFHRKQRVPTRIARIGILCSPALGDTLLFSGVLQDVRSAYPEAHIVHICTRQNLAAAEIIPGADERLVIDLKQALHSIRSLRAQRFDVLLDFTSWQRLTAFYTLMSGARYTAGFRTPGQNRSRGYDCTVEHRSDCHEIANFRSLLEGSGLTIGPIAHAPAIVSPKIAVQPFGEERDIVLLHPWASGQRSWLREWPQERWIALAQRLAAPQTLVVVTGAPSDTDRIAPLLDGLRAYGLRAEPFVSPDGFRTLTHLLQRGRLVVSVNTGVMHLAAIAGATVVAINGPNRNGRWGPVGAHAVGVEAPGPGCGYLHLGFNFDGQPTDCMERTTVDDVYAAAEDLLATKAAESKAAESKLQAVS